MIGFGRDQMVDHVDGRGKEDLDVGIASGIGKAFSQEGFTRTRVANEDDIHVSADKVEVEQVENTGFLLLPRFVMAEVELVDGEFIGEFGLPPSQGDGALKAPVRPLQLKPWTEPFIFPAVPLSSPLLF